MSEIQNTSMFPIAYSDMSGPLSGIATAGAGKFPNPFCDIASEYVPRDLNTVFDWAEYIYLVNGTYRSASRRVIRYFLTEVVLEGGSDDEKLKYDDFLNDKLHIMTTLADIGDDFSVYGNCFISLYFPFDRFLICPTCHTAFNSTVIDYKFDLGKGEFKGHCGKCDADVTFEHEDRRSPDLSRVKLVRWNPKHIRLRVHPVSGKIEYYMELDSNFVKKLSEGNRFYLDDTPWSMIDAAVKGTKDKTNPLFKFRDESIYHMKEATLAGLQIRGWGIPPIMPNFKLAYYIQLLRRYDEAIALDFIVPFRVLYPDVNSPAGAGTDPLSMMNMTNFISHMQSMVDKKRKNITDIQIAPFPIGYQMIGGEGRQLAPKDSIAMAIDELLNSLGYPAELYKGTLTIQAFPVALRLFEKTWGSLVDGYNDLLAWVLKRVSRHYMWGEINGSLRSVTLADDIERKALGLQAAAGMDISKATAYRPIGIDYMEEQRRVLEEQEEIQKLQQEAMERQQAQQGQMPTAPGQQPAGGVEPGATPGDVYEQGKALANQLLTQTPESMRRGELIKIKHSNPTLHAIVTQEMDNIRQEMSRQGQAMMLSQAKMASADDPMMGPMRLSLIVADQIMEYNRRDLQKIASDIAKKIPHAKEAFHFIYTRIKGWE